MLFKKKKFNLKKKKKKKFTIFYVYSYMIYGGTCRFGQLLGINPRIPEVYHIEIHIQFD